MAVTHRTINGYALKDQIDRGEDVILVNTLSAEKFAEGHIPGSENIPNDTPHFVQEVERLAGNKGRHVVVYCGGGKESALATFALEEAGFTNVEHFQGGMGEWHRLGFATETGLHSDSRR